MCLKVYSKKNSKSFSTYRLGMSTDRNSVGVHRIEGKPSSSRGKTAAIWSSTPCMYMLKNIHYKKKKESLKGLCLSCRWEWTTYKPQSPPQKKSFIMCILTPVYIVGKVSVHSSSTVGRLSKPHAREWVTTVPQIRGGTFLPLPPASFPGTGSGQLSRPGGAAPRPHSLPVPRDRSAYLRHL